jgi:hypothetical protein
LTIRSKNRYFIGQHKGEESMHRIVVIAVFIVFGLGFSKEASAQFLQLSYVFSPPPRADVLATVGVHAPLLKYKRVSAGPGIMAGAIFDNSKPFDSGTHAHFTWIVTATATLRVGQSWGVHGGYGWGFVPKSAKTHLDNYNTWLAGLSFGF